jgi:hypothetical protein
VVILRSPKTAVGLAEAKALIDAHSHVVLALANALVERRTLDAVIGAGHRFRYRG